MMLKDGKIFVIPGPGFRVRDPETMQLMKPEGEWKAANSYWYRRIGFGDVVEGAPIEDRPPLIDIDEPLTSPKINKKHKKDPDNGNKEI